MSIKKNVIEFLKNDGIYYGSIEMDSVVASFLDEMGKGLAGEKSSLAMIPTYIEGNPQIPRNKKVIVLDAGGTNLRAALVHFDQKGLPVIEEFRKKRMPGYDREVSKEEFYLTLVEHFQDFADQAETIGFCFSYPAEITPERDAIPTVFTKEIKAREVLGESIGDNMRAMLAKKGLKADHGVVVLNDTVATLLTGMSSHPGREYDGYIGYILGTGINGCYLETNRQIPKIKKNDDRSQVINAECGNFSEFPRGEVDRAFDSTTVNPGQYFQEKVSSGGYFGAYCRSVILDAADKGLFTPGAAEKLKGIGELETKDADNFLHNPQDEDNALVRALKDTTEEDRETLFWLLDSLLERAAKLMACSLSALVLKNDSGTSPLHPVCLTVDGTTFYLYNRFRQRVETYLQNYLSEDKGRYYEITRVEDAPLLGAAIAALTNL